MFVGLVISSCGTSVNYDNVNSSGKFMPGGDNELNGNAYVLADDKYMDLVQKSTDAYNAKDWDAMKALYTDEFVEWGDGNMQEYFDEMDTIDMKIFAMVPMSYGACQLEIVALS